MRKIALPILIVLGLVLGFCSSCSMSSDGKLNASATWPWKVESAPTSQPAK